MINIKWTSTLSFNKLEDQIELTGPVSSICEITSNANDTILSEGKSSFCMALEVLEHFSERVNQH